MKFPSAAFIKLTKEFYILKTVCMDIGAKQVDRQVKYMPDDKYNNKYDGTKDSLASHTSHLVYYGRNYSGCKSECKQSGIRKHIA